jgi:acyl carrier protein
MNDTTNQKLKSVFKEVFDFDIGMADQNLTRDDIPEWDSIRHLELILELETTFEVKFTIEEAMQSISINIIIGILGDHGIE